MLDQRCLSPAFPVPPASFPSGQHEVDQFEVNSGGVLFQLPSTYRVCSSNFAHRHIDVGRRSRTYVPRCINRRFRFSRSRVWYRALLLDQHQSSANSISLLARSDKFVYFDTLILVVFDRIRSECPSVLHKVVSIQGDVTEPDLALSEADRLELATKVNVVFHSAATVRFNESLKVAVNLNTLGTQRVIQLCRDMHKLQAFVHVSTAYSNADKKDVHEVVYPPPANPESVIQCCQTLSDDALEIVAERLRGKHPNTYTLTKALAEWVVAEQADDIPTAIVRPSIVTAAWREPVPGWVDNVCGITGIMMEIGRGTIRSIICNQNLIMDLIPVDFVVNTLITVAWHTATYRPNTLRVYNCTSGGMNPVRWEEFGQLTHRHACVYPTSHVMWYPGFTFRTNRLIHKICESLFHFFPAFVVDLILRLQGSKPIMMKISQRFQIAAKTGEFFALHEWNFHCDNIQALIRDYKDQALFEVDVTQMDWDMYVKEYMLGIRKFILKDSTDTLPSARRKLQR
uniref:Fatty acyl-CoA reductase n=1 Tax=Timema douglasi TaxID=61478 RepID=A0A7R8ZAF1_TIMDO|nr:unnamed protein product [Timema douglasi]